MTQLMGFDQPREVSKKLILRYTHPQTEKAYEWAPRSRKQNIIIIPKPHFKLLLQKE